MLALCLAQLVFIPTAQPSRFGASVSARLSESPAAGATKSLIQQLRAPGFGIGTGSFLLFALVANRLATDDLLNSQSRADLIATIAPVLLTLDALNNLDITPKEADVVELAGTRVLWTEPSVEGGARRELEWAAGTLMECLGCTSVAVWLSNGATISARGLFTGAAAAAPASAVQPGPLLTKCAASTSGAPEYLPALQLLPGRVEFSYFPEDTQALLMLPLGSQKGAVVLGANRKRAFASADVQWARAIAARLGTTLQ
jgi:hypothetical protein